MFSMTPLQIIRRKFNLLKHSLNERARRLWAVSEAQVLGYGGIALVVRATGISRSTLMRGLKEAAGSLAVEPGRVRRAGGGRKASAVLDPSLKPALESLVEPLSRGDPESPLRWTCKSTRRLAEELTRQGHASSEWLVRQLLYELGYSLQSNRKVKEGTNHPDRDAQFRHINRVVEKRIQGGLPVISVDTKKKELIGDFKNGGREWRPRGKPDLVRVHDFIDSEKGKAVPYGVYDVALIRQPSQSTPYVAGGRKRDRKHIGKHPR
jgi:hypothetical protein